MRRSATIEILESRLLLTAEAYAWQNVAIGGGGFVDGIVFSPSQPNVIYARTDIGGLFQYSATTNSWSELLDSVTAADSQQMGVLSLAIDPTNPNNLYLDTGQYAGTDGWVLRSTNGGLTFATTRLPFYVGGNSDGRATGERLAVDPNDPSILMLGSNNDGLWESTNSAESFAQVAAFPSAAGTDGTTFVTFDPTGAAGSPSQTIFVGVDSTAAGANLYETTNGGASWSEVAGTGGPTGLIPDHGERASDGNWYFTYANAMGPDSTATTGAVYRYNPTTGVWTNISPVVPGSISSYDQFGYEGLSVDPENPGTIVVTSIDRYNYGDQIWRTTDATAADPTWTAMYTGTATRNTSQGPWVAKFTDGIGNWAATAAIDPFNPAEVLYGDGQGLWETTNATASTVDWTFNDTGIEFTSALKLQAPPSGVPLLSALGDINGFADSTLDASPPQGATVAGSSLGTDDSIDFAGLNPNDQVLIGAPTTGGAYSTNDGQSWTAFAKAPTATVSGKSTTASGGTVAMSADGSAIVWASANAGVFYSTNDGSTWTLAGGSLSSNGQIVADRQTAGDFYYYVGGNVYFSSNDGQSFARAASGLASGGDLAASPYTAGVLWFAGSGGLYESTNFGTSFTRVGAVTSASEVAIGAAAPSYGIPSVYVWGVVGGLLDLYCSVDGGNTWTQINDAAHQWGGLVQTLAADPNNFGRIYVGINGRGIIMGSPQFATLSDNVLTVQDVGAITITANSEGGLTVNEDGISENFPDVSSIAVDFGSSAPSLQLDGAIAAPLSFFNGSAATVSVASGASAVLAASPDTDGVEAIPLAQLSIGSGAQLTVQPSSNADDYVVLVLGGLSIAGQDGDWLGTLNLTDNDLVLDGGGAAALAQVGNQIASGCNGGAWDGTGITTSSAAEPVTAPGGALESDFMGLGAILNANPDGSPMYGSSTSRGWFDGQSPSASAVLVKYTLLGDTDLSGAIDALDYAAIDNGFNQHLTGWANGDFNYDGVVNGDDYSLIDNSFNIWHMLQASDAAIAVAAPAGQAAAVTPARQAAGVASAAVATIAASARPRAALPPVPPSFDSSVAADNQWIDAIFDSDSIAPLSAGGGVGGSAVDA